MGSVLGSGNRLKLLVLCVLAINIGVMGAVFGQVSPNYRLKQGDDIGVGVLNEPLYQGGVRVTVGADGTITLPLVETLQARGLTVAELKISITNALKKYLLDPQVTVMIVQQAPSRVYVLGTGVRQPGAINIREGDRLTSVLPATGGVLENADKRGATISRSGQIIPIDLYELLNNKDLTQDIVLQDGDIIRIDADMDAKYFVTGYVPRPGVFPHIENVTVMEALTQAGWLLTRSQRRVKIYRKTGTKVQEINVDVDNITKKGNSAQNIVLKPLDIVYVAEKTSPDWDRMAGRIGAFANGLYSLRLLGIAF